MSWDSRDEWTLSHMRHGRELSPHARIREQSGLQMPSGNRSLSCVHVCAAATVKCFLIHAVTTQTARASWGASGGVVAIAPHWHRAQVWQGGHHKYIAGDLAGDKRPRVLTQRLKYFTG